MGPQNEDTTSAGIGAVRLCEQPLPRWEEVVALAEDGDHTGWSSYRLSGPSRTPAALEGADVDALLAAVRVTSPACPV